VSVTVSLRGGREARELLDSLSGRELQNRSRRASRRAAKVFRTAGRAEAKSRADLPDSFARFATKGHRTPVGTSTGPTSPLLNIFEGGAGIHRIGTPGQLLYNADAAFLARGPVTHPGMGARPFIGPLFAEHNGEASERAMDELLAGIR
jgi:hypothetical protein